MNARLLSLLCTIALPGPAIAQTSMPGDTVLQAGLTGRLKPIGKGVAIKRAGVMPDAGYFLLHLVDEQSVVAAKCPKRAFTETAQGRRWRQVNDRIYDEVFNRTGIWGLMAEFTVSNPLNEKTAQEVRLISIKDPHKTACVPQVLGVAPGETRPNYIFIQPINTNDHIYGREVYVNLKSVHTMKVDEKRVDALWTGLGFFAKVIAAPLEPLVASFAGTGKVETTRALTEAGGEASASRTFRMNPPGANSDADFVYLGFENFGQTDPATLTGGVTIQGDYLASVFTDGQFYSDTTKPSVDAVLDAIVFHDGGVDRTVREKLGTSANDLAEAATPALFSGGCSLMRNNLAKLGLSEVDAIVWLWAMASHSSHPDVAERLDAIPCLNGTARNQLARMHIDIAPYKPIVPTRRATQPEMEAALRNLGDTARNGFNPDLTARFADKIDLIVDDELAAGAGGLPGPARDRATVLDYIGKTFDHYGCYAPRDEQVVLPALPIGTPLADKARAAAMILQANGDAGVPYIVSVGFDPVPDQPEAKARVSRIAILKRGTASNAVIADMIKSESAICPKP